MGFPVFILGLIRQKKISLIQGDRNARYLESLAWLQKVLGGLRKLLYVFPGPYEGSGRKPDIQDEERIPISASEEPGGKV